jgi:hypothetical protein
MLTLRGRLAWAHDFNTDRNLQAAFVALPGSAFVVNGALPSANTALTSLSAELAWRNGWAASATFDGQFSDTTGANAGKGVVRLRLVMAHPSRRVMLFLISETIRGVKSGVTRSPHARHVELNRDLASFHDAGRGPSSFGAYCRH